MTGVAISNALKHWPILIDPVCHLPNLNFFFHHVLIVFGGEALDSLAGQLSAVHRIERIRPNSIGPFVTFISRTVEVCFGGLFYRMPDSIALRAKVLFDAPSILATMYGTVRALQEARSARSGQAAVAWMAAGLGTALTVNGVWKTVQGFEAIRKIDDPEQRYFTLKYQDLRSLPSNEKKECRAVVIDGMSSEWGGLLDDSIDPMIRVIYQHCDTRTYRADAFSLSPICRAVEEGADALRGAIDILLLAGHSNSEYMVVGEGSFLRKYHIEDMNCFVNYTSPNAQIVLAGCNTATGKDSLAEHVSRHAPGREFIGFTAKFHTLCPFTSFEGKKISIWHAPAYDQHGNFVFGNTARSFKTS